MARFRSGVAELWAELMAVAAVAVLLLFGVATVTPAAVAAGGPTVWVVNSTADPGDGVCDETECTLREALTAANDNGQATDEIHFDIAGELPATIQPTAELPEIVTGVIIDGWSQPGYTGTPVVELDGSSAGLSHGLFFEDPPQGPGAVHVVRGLVINRFEADGIRDESTRFPLVVDGCYIGTDVTGTVDMGNGGRAMTIGVGYEDSEVAVTIRDSVLSGNGSFGLYSNWRDFTMVGNRIGTDVTGTIALGNGSSGVQLNQPNRIRLGGTSPEEANVISANAGNGLRLNPGLHSSGDWAIRGNRIGTDLSGTRPLGNSFEGIEWDYLLGPGAVEIGGLEPGAGNVIAANGTDGIDMANVDGDAKGATVQLVGNWIGTDPTGQIDLGNGEAGILLNDCEQIQIGGAGPAGNVIAFNGRDGIHVSRSSNRSFDVWVADNVLRDNGRLAIELGDDGPSANDPLDTDDGPNHRQNHPVLTTAVRLADSVDVTGVLDSSPGTFLVHVAAAPACGPRGRGVSARPLGSFTVTTDETGHADFAVSFPTPVPVGWVVSATATSGLNTSEFSPCVTITET